MSPLDAVIFFDISFWDNAFWDNASGNAIEVPAVVAWLVAGAVFFTLCFRFIHLTGFLHGIDCVRGRYSAASDVGELSHFQALAAALSATVGLGNSAGVAFALVLLFGLVIVGGFVGTLIQGFRRAAFSHEAGVGSAAIAHSAARTDEPIREGYAEPLEPQGAAFTRSTCFSENFTRPDAAVSPPSGYGGKRESSVFLKGFTAFSVP